MLKIVCRPIFPPSAGITILTGALISLGVVPVVSGQVAGISNTTSTPVPGVPHDYITGLNEVVNPANGALSVSIKAPTPHERGVNWPTYVYRYDSNGVYTLTPTWTTSSGGSGSFTTLQYLNLVVPYAPPSAQPQPLLETTTVQTGQYTYTTYQCQITSGYVFTDPDGGRHGLGLSTATAVSPPNSNACSFFPSASNYYQGGDEQYKATVNPSTLAVTVIDNHGNAVGSEDSNGNINGNAQTSTINGSTSTLTLKTTTGRTETYVTSGGTFTVTLPGVNGSYTDTYNYVSAAPPSITIPFTVVDQGTGGNGCQLTSIPSEASTWPSQTSQVASETFTLPNGQQYHFYYDSSTGLLNEIVYPTGAWVKYTWQILPGQEGVQYRSVPSSGGGLCALTHGWFAITKRVVSYDGTNSDQEQDFSYATTWPASGQSNSYQWTSKTTTVTTKDLLRGTSFNTVYAYTPVLPPPTTDPAGTWGDQGYMPQESTITYKDTNGSVLKTVTKTWQTVSLLSGECETLPNGQTSGKFYTYLSYTGFSSQNATPLNPNANLTDLPTDVAEYDYGAVSSSCAKPSSTPMRETKTTYESFGTTPLFS